MRRLVISVLASRHWKIIVMRLNRPTKRACFLLILTLALSATLAAHRVPQTYADGPYIVRLPLVAKMGVSNTLPTPLPGTPPEQIALDRVNAYRALAGVPSLAPHVALLAAAQHHADYDLLNHSDPAAWTYGPHGEVSGKPGFSGTMPGDRAVAAGYPWAAGWEVMGYFDDPLRTVDGLMATVFHRINILTSTHAYLGYGHGRSAVEAVDVLDFGRGPSTPSDPPDRAVYPGPGQVEVPRYGAGETPSPLPMGASYPIGYPITLQPLAGTTLTVRQAELHDASGIPIPVYPNPPDCGTSCYALIPTAGLRAATTYTVHVAGAIDGAPFDKTWSFTTTTCSDPLSC
jgi:uncharacterized protein YkwD